MFVVVVGGGGGGGGGLLHVRKCVVVCFRGTGRSAKIIVTSVTGHVFSTDFGPEHNSWDIPPVRLFRAKVKKKIESKGVAHTLSNLASGVDFLVLWLDCDREGENICFEVRACVCACVHVCVRVRTRLVACCTRSSLVG